MPLRIGELARRTGVEAGTLRAWERRFGLLQPSRTGGGQRQYSEADIGRVMSVRRLMDEGLTLASAAERVVSAGDGGPSTEPEGRLLRQILQTLDQGILVGKDARTRYANRRAAQMLGCTADELMARSILDFIPEEERAEAKRRVAELRQGGVLESFEQRLRRDDGTTLIVETQVRPMFDRAGRYEGSVSLMRDVSDRRQLEDELRARRLRGSAIAVLGARALGTGRDSASSHDALLRDAVEATRRLLDADRAGYLELNEDGSLSPRASDSDVFVPSLPAGTGSLAGFTVLARTVVVVDDVKLERRFDVEAFPPGTMSAVAAPVFGPLGVRGVLSAGRAPRGSFDDAAVDFVQAMANVVGTALK